MDVYLSSILYMYILLKCVLTFIKLFRYAVSFYRTTFFRISKLLQAGITPVMVFEGYPPQLKRETINKRRHQRQSSGLQVFCSTEDRPMMDPGSTSADTKMAPNQAMRPLTRPEKEVRDSLKGQDWKFHLE